ncbi:MAG: hypothetical protein E7327_01460 [Clostridiales bacterium]|nr:hypothetical protein [Clostridiales bacterium]
MNHHPEDWGRRVVERALEFAEHSWTASDKNVLHGIDEDGCPVETPDETWQGEMMACGWWKPGEVNVGVPYGWGNASTIEAFDAGIRSGKYAGNVPEKKGGRASRHTVGVDCSGLLTICWELPRRISTREIPDYASVIECVDDIRQGEVFAKVGSHVMFFVAFLDAEGQDAVIVDATRTEGRVSRRKVSVPDLLARGYKIYRRN